MRARDDEHGKPPRDLERRDRCVRTEVTDRHEVDTVVRGCPPRRSSHRFAELEEGGQSLLIALSRSRHPRANRELQLLVSVSVPHRWSRRSSSSILASAGTDRNETDASGRRAIRCDTEGLSPLRSSSQSRAGGSAEEPDSESPPPNHSRWQFSCQGADVSVRYSCSSMRGCFSVPTLCLALIAGASAGCVGQHHLLERGPGGGTSPSTFWPPPRSTSVAVASASPDATFGHVERRIAAALRDGGYDDARWYPIGIDFRHGFAVTTRVEKIDEQARPVLDRRWSSLHAEPPTLRWLAYARHLRLPERGRYRAFLIALTDLPETSSHVAPTWNDESFMEGPGLPEGAPPREIPTSRPTTTAFHVAVYVYEYEANASNADGAFVARDDVDAARHLRGSGLDALLLTGGAPQR